MISFTTRKCSDMRKKMITYGSGSSSLVFSIPGPDNDDGCNEF